MGSAEDALAGVPRPPKRMTPERPDQRRKARAKAERGRNLVVGVGAVAGVAPSAEATTRQPIPKTPPLRRGRAKRPRVKQLEGVAADAALVRRAAGGARLAQMEQRRWS